MRTLDRSRDFSHVLGMGRTRYGQDGVYFDVKGNEVVEDEPDTEPQEKVTREELEKLHWTKLRARLNALDMEYTNRDEAIELILTHG